MSVKFKAILLDLDGTLVNTLHSLHYTMNQAMDTYGLDPITLEQTKKYVGNGGYVFVERSIEATANRLYREAEKWEEKDEDKAFDLDQQADEVMELIDDVYKTYRDLFVEGCTYMADPYPGMKESLCTLKDRGFKVVCVTNKSYGEAVKVLDHAFGEGFFDYISGDDGTHPLKPDAAVIDDVLSHIHCSNADCVYVGDTNTDMETARNSSLKSIGCIYGFRTQKELEDAGADILIESAEDLVKAVDYLESV